MLPLLVAGVGNFFTHKLLNAGHVLFSVDVDLTDITCVKCRMIVPDEEELICPDEFATRVLQR